MSKENCCRSLRAAAKAASLSEALEGHVTAVTPQSQNSTQPTRHKCGSAHPRAQANKLWLS